MKKNIQKTKKAFTLVEILVSLAIFSLIIITMSGMFGSFIKNYQTGRDVQTSLEDAQQAINRLAKKIRTSSVVSPTATPNSKFVRIYEYSQPGSARCYEYWFDEGSQTLNVAQAGPNTNPGHLPNSTEADFTADVCAGISRDNMRNLNEQYEDVISGGGTVHVRTAGSGKLINSKVSGYFDVIPSDSTTTPPTIGKVTIYANLVQGNGGVEKVPIQTTVSLRDMNVTTSGGNGSSGSCRDYSAPANSKFCSTTNTTDSFYTHVNSCGTSSNGCEYECDSDSAWNGSSCVLNNFAFTLTPDPSLVSVVAGETGTSTITIKKTSGTAGEVELLASGFPAGSDGTFSPDRCTPNGGSSNDTCTSTLTITTLNSTPIGNSTISVIGAKGNLSESVGVTLNVTNGGNGSAGCGSSNGSYFASAPSSNLCSSGTASAISTSATWPGSFNWTCTDGGTTSNCSAKFDGKCEETGWAWGGGTSSGSPNTALGWISFSSKNTNAAGTYSIQIPTKDGVISGYAWSENLGWISFNSGDIAGCPNGICEASRSGNNVIGWAKILSVKDGWNGWIKLDSSNSFGGVTMNPSTGGLSGWAWSDEFGWIDFSGTVGNVAGNKANCIIN